MCYRWLQIEARERGGTIVDSSFGSDRGVAPEVAIDAPVDVVWRTITGPDDELWSAIADPSRRRVLDLLVRDGEASASGLAGRVPFSRQAVAKHLAVLEQSGLVGRRAQGREVRYHVNADRLDLATRAMADLARQWDRRLLAIKQLAGATQARTAEEGHGEDADPSDRASGAMGDSPPASGERKGADPRP
jgi:ArsR family transcriptional regulator, cadmium/lead-responsive transcriptional repressor